MSGQILMCSGCIHFMVDSILYSLLALAQSHRRHLVESGEREMGVVRKSQRE